MRHALLAAAARAASAQTSLDFPFPFRYRCGCEPLVSSWFFCWQTEFQLQDTRLGFSTQFSILPKIYAEDFQRFREKEREVLLLQLEINIEHHLLAISKGNNTLKRLDVFTHVLSSGDFARLEQEPVTLHKQACLAITLYEQRLETSLPEKIKEKIFQLYEE